MLLVALEFDKAYNPVTVSLLCHIRIVMISQKLADLIHESQFRIWFEFGLIFHDIIVLAWKTFHLSTLLSSMKRILNLRRKSTRSIAENEDFVTLIRVAQEDSEIKSQLSSILALDSFNRKSALNTFLEELRFRQAPKEFISAMATLLDEMVAEQVLKILTAENSSRAG